MAIDQDERTRRADERAKRREQAATKASGATDETQGSDVPSGQEAPDAEGGTPTVRTGATLAAAGALVGAAIGAASAIRARSDGDSHQDAEPGDRAAGSGMDRGEGEQATPTAEQDIEHDEREADRDADPDDGDPGALGKATADGGSSTGDQDSDDQPEPGTPAWMMREARRHLQDLTGRDVEGVLALERNDGGWLARVEVVELRRIPSTTDVLGVYDVTLDSDGEIVTYRRTERYIRSQAGGEEA